jgi:hypothetical protein
MYNLECPAGTGWSTPSLLACQFADHGKQIMADSTLALLEVHKSLDIVDQEILAYTEYKGNS